jgi:hypothetical protein
LVGVFAPQQAPESARSFFDAASRIRLEDFSLEESRTLLPELKMREPEKVLSRIFDWTQGHPYLTQLLCYDALLGKTTAAGVEAMVQKRFFENPRQYLDDFALGTSDNLFRAALRCPLGPDIARLYKTLITRPESMTLADAQETMGTSLGSVVDRLRMVGVIAQRDMKLSVRNKIVRRVFDVSWLETAFAGVTT